MLKSQCGDRVTRLYHWTSTFNKSTNSIICSLFCSWASEVISVFEKVAPDVGLEPSTPRLRISRIAYYYTSLLYIAILLYIYIYSSSSGSKIDIILRRRINLLGILINCCTEPSTSLKLCYNSVLIS